MYDAYPVSVQCVVQVKAMAAETGLPFFSISSASIMDKYVGESERKVQELFEDARRNQPSIIFIGRLSSSLNYSLESADWLDAGYTEHGS